MRLVYNHARVAATFGTVAFSAAAGLAVAAGTGVLPGTGSPASAARVAPSEVISGHRVACALTEDSRLTTCGPHRVPLDYRNGGWFAPGAGIPSWLSAEKCPAHEARDLGVTRRNCVNFVGQRMTVTITHKHGGIQVYKS